MLDYDRNRAFLSRKVRKDHQILFNVHPIALIEPRAHRLPLSASRRFAWLIVNQIMASAMGSYFG
jgi:hypothetical protein